MKEMMALAGPFVAVLVRALYSGDFCDWSVYCMYHSLRLRVLLLKKQ